MNNVLLALKLGILFLSNLGYWEYFSKKSCMHRYFAPAFTVCFQITVLFFAGILHVLQFVSILLLSVGLFLFINAFFSKSLNLLSYFNVGYLFLFFSLAVIIVAVRGKLFYLYDNFSHWAVLTKHLFQLNRLPSFLDSNIMFQYYPVGSALYIYYFSRFVSISESTQMLAQAYMMITFIMPLFIPIRKNVVIAFIFTTLFSNFLFIYNVRITELPVDTLLPLQGSVGLYFLFHECMNLTSNKNSKVSPVYSIPFFCTMLQIKNSGILFYALGIVLISLFIYKNKNSIGGGYIKQCLLALFFPAFTLLVWKKHCAEVFYDASTSKHAMSINNYVQTFQSKSSADIRTITSEMLNFSYTGADLWIFVAFIVILGLITILFVQSKRILYRNLVIACISVYLIYIIGMYAMYLFSMPTVEALMLGSASRYRKTIFIFLYYFMALYFSSLIDCINNIKQSLFNLIISCSLLVGATFYTNPNMPTVFHHPSNEIRKWFQNAIDDNWVSYHSSYLIFLPENDAGYTHFMCRYLLNDRVGVIQITKPEQLEYISGFKNIFVYDKDNPIINNWISEHYPDQLGRDVIITE